MLARCESNIADERSMEISSKQNRIALSRYFQLLHFFLMEGGEGKKMSIKFLLMRFFASII